MNTSVVRSILAGLAAGVLLVLAGPAMAAEHQVEGKVVSIDHKGHKITVAVGGGHETFHVSPEVEVIGPKGGNSGHHLNDKRLVAGAPVKLTFGGKDKKTVEKIHVEK
jgi:hypothetical protein